MLTFFLLSFGVLLLDGATAGWTTSHLFCVYRSSLKDPLFYLRLFGHVLGHADLDHFLNNMLLFLVIGPPMEEKYGSVPLLKAIVLTALVSGVLQCILFPGVALLGASGIVFMLIMLSSLAGGGGGIPVTMLLVAALYLGDQIYAILFTTSPTSCTLWAGSAAPPSAFTPPTQGRAKRGGKVILIRPESPFPAAIRAVWPKFARRAPVKIVILSIAFWAAARYNAIISSNGAVSHLRLAAPFVCVRRPACRLGATSLM